MNALPNIISASRGIAALAMLFFPVFSPWFWALYCWGGISDSMVVGCSDRISQSDWHNHRLKQTTEACHPSFGIQQADGHSPILSAVCTYPFRRSHPHCNCMHFGDRKSFRRFSIYPQRKDTESNINNSCWHQTYCLTPVPKFGVKQRDHQVQPETGRCCCTCSSLHHML